jgi:hypothetical protein
VVPAVAVAANNTVFDTTSAAAVADAVVVVNANIAAVTIAIAAVVIIVIAVALAVDFAIAASIAAAASTVRFWTKSQKVGLVKSGLAWIGPSSLKKVKEK